MGNKNKRVCFFDYLRALAIVFVIIVHYHSPTLPGGSIGVSIFFCLSGYLITKILLGQNEVNLPNIGKFIFRRFMRVYPAYFLVLILIFILMYISDYKNLPLFLEAVPGLLTFTSMPKWIGMQTGVFWTLQVEFWFYVLMPFIVLCFGKGKALISLIFLLIGLSFFYKLAPLANIDLTQFSPFSTLIFWMDNLLYGSLVAVFSYHKRLQIRRVAQLPILIGSFTILFLIARFISNTDRQFTWPLMATAASLATAVIIATYLAKDEVQEQRYLPVNVGIMFSWIGRISYSLYLLHAIPLDYVSFTSTSEILCALIFVFLFASITYYFIERTGIKIARALT